MVEKNLQTIFKYAGALIAFGIVWGTLNARINVLENQIRDQKDFAERLARIEEKVIFISENIKK
jgi:hypothetical protein